MNKTISINPDLFKITKKKRPPKANLQPRDGTNKTARRNHVLKFIRNEQEKTYRKLLEGDVATKSLLEDDGGDFQQSLDYLMSLTRDEKAKAASIAASAFATPQNHTLKQRQQNETGWNPENVSLMMPSTMNQDPPMRLQPPVMPQWGCLRNGTLPTFRAWNQTQKVRSPLESPMPTMPTPMQTPMPMQTTVQTAMPNVLQNNAALRNSEFRQTMELAEQMKPLVAPRQQRTVRKTYNLGKNKSLVSVLVSNKTLRNRVLSKTHEIRQKTIEEVKKYLINKGFVRVGTTAPHDVLRKMYESANLICGDIQNHNPENLLFNFLHPGS